jgi:hypothetical protein
MILNILFLSLGSWLIFPTDTVALQVRQHNLPKRSFSRFSEVGITKSRLLFKKDKFEDIFTTYLHTEVSSMSDRDKQLSSTPLVEFKRLLNSLKAAEAVKSTQAKSYRSKKEKNETIDSYQMDIFERIAASNDASAQSEKMKQEPEQSEGNMEVTSSVSARKRGRKPGSKNNSDKYIRTVSGKSSLQTWNADPSIEQDKRKIEIGVGQSNSDRAKSPSLEHILPAVAFTEELGTEEYSQEELEWLPNVYAGGRPSAPKNFLSSVDSREVQDTAYINSSQPLGSTSLLENDNGLGENEISLSELLRDYVHSPMDDESPNPFRVKLVSVITTSTTTSGANGNESALSFVEHIYDYIKNGTDHDPRIEYQVLCLTEETAEVSSLIAREILSRINSIFCFCHCLEY